MVGALTELSAEVVGRHVRADRGRRGRARGARARPAREARPAGRQAARRPQPQRPGRHRPAALPAAQRPGAGGGAVVPGVRAARPRRAVPGRRRAGHDAPAARAAGAHRPPAAGPRPLDRPRRRPAAGLGQADGGQPARRRRAGRLVAAPRPRRGRGRARLRPRRGQLDRRRQRPRLRRRVLLRRGAARRPPLPAGGGGRALDVDRVRLGAAGRRLGDRVVDHAAEEEPRHRRAGPRQVRPVRRQPDRPADHAQGPAAGLRPRPAGGQGAGLRLHGAADAPAARRSPGWSRR